MRKYLLLSRNLLLLDIYNLHRFATCAGAVFGFGNLSCWRLHLAHPLYGSEQLHVVHIAIAGVIALNLF